MGGSMDGKPRIFWGWPPLHSINKERLTMRHGYLIDMDGVLYRGSEMIAGADQFVRELRRREIPFRFLTNNSQRTRRDIVAKLGPMGIEVEEEHVYTCAMATAAYLEWQKPSGTAFVIGEGGLLNALHAHGYAIVDNDPDYVVVGEGRTFNLELVEAAVKMILRGAKLVATNLDPNCPTKDGLRPGCGAMVAMLETDILGGVQLGLHTVLVLTGGTKREDLARYAYSPELVVDSIADLHQLLVQRRWEPWWSLQSPVGRRARGGANGAREVAA